MPLNCLSEADPADSGVEALQLAPLDLTQNFREACRQGRTLAAAKQISFQEPIASVPITVEGDAHALQFLFLDSHRQPREVHPQRVAA